MHGLQEYTEAEKAANKAVAAKRMKSRMAKGGVMTFFLRAWWHWSAFVDGPESRNFNSTWLYVKPMGLSTQTCGFLLPDSTTKWCGFVPRHAAVLRMQQVAL